MLQQGVRTVLDTLCRFHCPTCGKRLKAALTPVKNSAREAEAPEPAGRVSPAPDTSGKPLPTSKVPTEPNLAPRVRPPVIDEAAVAETDDDTSQNTHPKVRFFGVPAEKTDRTQSGPAAAKPLGAASEPVLPTADKNENAVAKPDNTGPAAQPVDLWQQLRPLLERRQYEAAQLLIDQSLANGCSPALRQELEADRADIQRLSELATVAEDSLGKLEPGTPFEINGIAGYEFVQFDAESKSVVVQMRNQKKSVPIAELRSVQVAGLARGETSPLTRGVFHLVDELGDLDLAGELLEEAASRGS